MEKVRLILIILHIFITIFLFYNLYPKVKSVSQASEKEKQISRTIGHVNKLLCISLYHSSCLIAIWYSRRYAAGMIRATGILLIGEFFEVFTIALEHFVETHEVLIIELIFDVIAVWLFIPAIYFTFHLAKQISNRQKDLMQLELLATTSTNDLALDGRGEFSLV